MLARSAMNLPRVCAVAGEKKRYSNAGGRLFPRRRLGAARLWEARGPLSTSSGMFLNALLPHPWFLLERSDFFPGGARARPVTPTACGVLARRRDWHPACCAPTGAPPPRPRIQS